METCRRTTHCLLLEQGRSLGLEGDSRLGYFERARMGKFVDYRGLWGWYWWEIWWCLSTKCCILL